jgi:acyl-CoA thioester hydrolase
MPAIYSHPHIVTADEIDGLGHVNNLHYLKWMQTAAVAHSSEQGWPPERYRELRSAWVVRTHHIEYLQPAFADEEIIVKTWVSDFRKVTSLRKYKIVRPKGGATLATGETNWAFLGLAPYVPRRIPPELSTAFIVVPPAEEPT